jgi:hypothetical protein
VVVAFFGAGSGVADGCADGVASGSVIVPEFAFSSTGPGSFRGLPTVGFAAIATFFDFTAGSGLNGARFGSIRVVAVVLEKQPCEVHVCTSPRGGKGQQPINVAHRAPMRRVLIKSFSRGQNPFPRWLEGDNDENK